ncbi:MAG: T9SS type A sorting domain-containing protein [Bacteroidia bacterium]
MKKFNITLILLLLVNLMYAQNPLVKQWDKRFGGISNEVLTCFQQCADGGYILGGYSGGGISGDMTQVSWGGADYWIIKIDSLGNKEWDKDFGGTEDEILYFLQQTSDKGYILGGWSKSGISGDKTIANWDSSGNTYDYWIVKIDSLGNKQWDKGFGGIGNDYFYSLQQASDKGYILGGSSFSGTSGDKTQSLWGACDYWIVKTDSLGNKQWDKDFGGSTYDYFRSMRQTSDGGYILGGFSYSDISGDKTQSLWGVCDYWIVKTDSLGNKQWDKDFGGTQSDALLSLQQTADMGYVLGGVSASEISGDKTQPLWGATIGETDFWVVKIDSSGTKQWDKDFGGTDFEDEFGNISQTSDGGYLLAGTSYSNISGNKTESNLGQEQTWVLKTDSLGIKEWDKTLHTTGHEENGYAIQSKDGCYAMANVTLAGIGGDKTQPSQGLLDFWIIKLCDTTETTSINQIFNPESSFLIYPNPTNSNLNFVLNQSKNIIITNVLGEIVLQKKVDGKAELDVSFLSTGIYIIKAGNEVRKFAKE